MAEVKQVKKNRIKKFLKAKLSGSFTIEAAFVMAAVLLVIGSIIKEGFFLHDQVRGTLVLQETIELIRRGEWENGTEEAAGIGQKKSAPMFSFSDYHLSLKDLGIYYQGTAQSGAWKKEIRIRIFNPEDFLRLARGLVF